MSAQNWEIEIYPPPREGWPYVVVTRLKGKDPDAQFESTPESAEKLKAQIHERLWRVQNVDI